MTQTMSLHPGSAMVGVSRAWQGLRPVRRRTVVYPGHGDDTTLGAERPHLDEWRARGW